MKTVILLLLLAVPAFSEPLPLGTLTPTNVSDPNCPSGFTCKSFNVNCPGAPQIKGFYSYRLATNPIGTVIFFTGGMGTTWWSNTNQTLPVFVNDLIARRLSVLQVRWTSDWEDSAPGVNSGMVKLSCRPATAISFLHQKFQPGTNRLILTGNSGGASQVSYALAYYGLDNIVDVLIPTGGPPHSVLQKSCLRNAGEEIYWFDDGTRRRIDTAFGFFNGNGPCYQRDRTKVPRWISESVGYGGNDYLHPNTRVHVILGEHDRMQGISSDYQQKLMDSGTPIIVEIVPGAGHNLVADSLGRSALMDAITAP